MGSPDEAGATDLRDLYRQPLADFVAARNQLAGELKRQGRTEEAAAMRRLGRPSIALWAVNQVAAAESEEIGRLLALGDRLAEAQARLLTGEREAAEAWRHVGAEEAGLLRRLRERAAEILADAGHGAAEPVLRRIETTLRAGAVASAEVRAALSDARLTAELEPGGFGTTQGPVDTTPPPAPRPREDPGAKSRRREEEAVRREAERDLDERATLARRLRREAERTAARAERARADLAAADDAMRLAAAEADAAESAVEAARRRLQVAREAPAG